MKKPADVLQKNRTLLVRRERRLIQAQMRPHKYLNIILRNQYESTTENNTERTTGRYI